jgi:hypothetical protein
MEKDHEQRRMAPGGFLQQKGAQGKFRKEHGGGVAQGKKKAEFFTEARKVQPQGKSAKSAKTGTLSESELERQRLEREPLGSDEKAA